MVSRGAIAVTVEQFREYQDRNNGPDKEPSPLSKIFRSWAGHLIVQEDRALRAAEPVIPSLYQRHEMRKEALSRAYNEVSYGSDFSSTLAAVKTIWNYRFGLRIQQPQ